MRDADARSARPLSGALCGALAAAACAAVSAPDAAPQLPPLLQAVLPALLEDAARRAGSPASALRVVSAEAVTWADGALGCPQPGRLYTQALVPGHRVRIAAPAGAHHDYHLSLRGGWLWCDPARAQPPLPPSGVR